MDAHDFCLRIASGVGGGGQLLHMSRCELPCFVKRVLRTPSRHTDFEAEENKASVRHRALLYHFRVLVVLHGQSFRP